MQQAPVTKWWMDSLLYLPAELIVLGLLTDKVIIDIEYSSTAVFVCLHNMLIL